MRYIVQKGMLVFCMFMLAFLSGTGAVYAAPIDEPVYSSGELQTNLVLELDPPIYHEQKRVALNGAADDFFGFSVALSGDGKTALVGASMADVAENSRQGTATVFVLTPTGWVEQTTLMDANGTSEALFGSSVALSADGNVAVVGADSADSGSGAVYVFTRSAGVWSQGLKLTPSVAQAAARLGMSVAVSADGNTVLAGAYHAAVGVNGSQGAAYVFKKGPSGWAEVAKLTASDGLADDEFGFSVALSRDGLTAAVGARDDDLDTNVDQGSVYIFSASTGSWVEQKKIWATDGAANDRFGYSVALAGDGKALLAGVPYAVVDGNTAQGAAYVYYFNSGNWGGQQKLAASDGQAESWLGYSVAFSGDGLSVLLGAYRSMVGANTHQGALYLMERSPAGTWSERKKFTASDGEMYDRLGSGTALSDDAKTILAGAYRDDIGTNTDQGSVYFYTYDEPPTVVSIQRAGQSPTNEASVNYTVTFSEEVSDVDLNDFSLSTSGSISGAALSHVSGSGAVYTVTVTTGAGLGSLRLDMPKTATINDLVGNKIKGLPYTGGQEYIRGKRYYTPLLLH